MTVIDNRSTALTIDTEPHLVGVADDVHAVVQLDGTWGLSNAAVAVSDGASLLVDTFFTERRNRLLRELVAEVSPVAPRYLVNTHHHGDHVHGNGFFPEAIVIGHRSTRAALAVLDPSVSARRFATVDFGETRVTLPDVVFDDALRVQLNELAVDVISPGTAHCPGNTVVHIPQRGVLVAGDLLLAGCTPTFVGGSASGFLEVIARLRSLSPEVVVPGHGPVCGPEVFDETENYVRFVMDLAAQAVGRGHTALEAAQNTELGDFAPLLDGERIVGNLHRAMSEITGARVDLPAMWRDTTTFLGHGVQSRA